MDGGFRGSVRNESVSISTLPCGRPPWGETDTRRCRGRVGTPRREGVVLRPDIIVPRQVVDDVIVMCHSRPEFVVRDPKYLYVPRPFALAYIYTRYNKALFVHLQNLQYSLKDLLLPHTLGSPKTSFFRVLVLTFTQSFVFFQFLVPVLITEQPRTMLLRPPLYFKYEEIRLRTNISLPHCRSCLYRLTYIDLFTTPEVLPVPLLRLIILYTKNSEKTLGRVGKKRRTRGEKTLRTPKYV